MIKNFEPLLSRLINSKYKVSVTVSGCGCRFLQYFSLYPGSSKFFLEGHNLYARQSITRYLGLDTYLEKYCTADTAKLQANHTFTQAQKILFDQLGRDYGKLININEPQSLVARAVGVSLNGSLSSNYQKKGKVKVYLAIRKPQALRQYQLVMKQPLGREQQQEIFSFVAMQLLVDYLDNTSPDKKFLEQMSHIMEISETHSDIAIHEHDNEAVLLPSMFIDPPLKKVAIFSGSYNPFHTGHYDMYKIAASRIPNMPIILELTVKNADKLANLDVLPRLQSIVHFFRYRQNIPHPIAYLTLQQIKQEMRELGIQVLISSRGKFVDKGLKQGWFVLGADTYIRLWDPKFYKDERDMKKAIANMISNEIKLLVFRRRSKTGSEITNLEDKGVEFDLVDEWQCPLSSTEIRDSWISNQTKS